jgi:Ca2+-binding EF-hand superfamily protein
MKKTLYAVTLLVAAVCLAEEKAATPTTPPAPAHPNGMHVRPMQTHMPKEVIEKFDKDGDGKLNETEMKAAREAHQAEMIKKFDKDGDGKLSPEELKAAGEARRAEMIKKFDKDGDGKLSDDEKKIMHDTFMKGREAGKGREGKSAKPNEEKTNK